MSDLVENRDEFASRSILFHAWSSLSNIRNLAIFVYLATILGSTILCINAIWTLTGSDPTLLSLWLSQIAPLNLCVIAIAAYLLIGLIIGMVGRFRALRILIYLLVTWVASVYAIRMAQPFIPYIDVNFPFQNYKDAIGAITFRLSFLAPVIPMFFVYRFIEKGDSGYPFRFGNLFRKTIVFNGAGKKSSWAVWLVRIWIFVALPLFVFFQMQVDFEPIKSGKLLIFLVPIFVLALLNAFSEELLIQGFFLPNETRILCPGAAILLHGLFFGLLHWGSAPDAISGLPEGLMIGLGAWIGSKAVLETRGLGFSILAHMSIDVALFSAHFI